MKALLNVFLFVASIYFYNSNQTLIAFLLFMTLFYTICIRPLYKILRQKFAILLALQNTNSKLTITYNLEKLLTQSGIMDDILKKLHELKIKNELNTGNELISLLIENHKRLHEDSLSRGNNEILPSTHVIYKFMSGVCWKNEALYQENEIFNRIVMPYKIEDGPQIKPSLGKRIIENYLIVDMCVINGHLIFRIGPFEEGHKSYYKTLFSFPLVYIPSHCIPPQYLNFSKLHIKKSNETKSSYFSKKIQSIHDAIDYERMVNIYTYFFIHQTTNYSPGYNAMISKHDKYFETKFNRFLEENNINTVSRDESIYSNDMLCIEVADFVDAKFDKQISLNYRSH